MNPIDMIFDEGNTEPITLYTENGEEVKFEQIAVIPLDGTVYVILKPMNSGIAIAEDEALVFSIQEVDDEECLVITEDDATITRVFEEYYKLLADAGVV